jgi:hypothetical protein
MPNCEIILSISAMLFVILVFESPVSHIHDFVTLWHEIIIIIILFFF